MTEDWDLFAVVRSCASASAITASGNTAENSNEEPWACLASLTFEEEKDPFFFPNLVQASNNNGSLQDSYRAFLTNPNPTITVNNPNSTGSFPSEFSGQHFQPQSPTTTTMGIDTPTTDPVFVLGQSRNQQQPQYVQERKTLSRQPKVQPPVVQPPAGTILPFRSVHSQGPKSRKRKNHQIKKTVCHVTAGNLSSDPWAWRKYGQKPIKGSSCPRNYYRCSSSKACAARKQVERSNLDPNIFIVTYTGEHAHPKPTHRNSLAGSTRNKLSTVQKSILGKSPASETATDATCSSPLSAISVSPNAPLSAPEEGTRVLQDADVENDAGEGNDEEMLDGETEEDGILNSNIKIDEDLFK
ncbi:hypothetical protein SLE2022_373240 [Rubroshorea leprosula]